MEYKLELHYKEFNLNEFNQYLESIEVGLLRKKRYVNDYEAKNPLIIYIYKKDEKNRKNYESINSNKGYDFFINFDKIININEKIIFNVEINIPKKEESIIENTLINVKNYFEDKIKNITFINLYYESSKRPNIKSFSCNFASDDDGDLPLYEIPKYEIKNLWIKENIKHKNISLIDLKKKIYDRKLKNNDPKVDNEFKVFPEMQLILKIEDKKVDNIYKRFATLQYNIKQFPFIKPPKILKLKTKVVN